MALKTDPSAAPLTVPMAPKNDPSTALVAAAPAPATSLLTVRSFFFCSCAVATTVVAPVGPVAVVAPPVASNACVGRAEAGWPDQAGGPVPGAYPGGP